MPLPAGSTQHTAKPGQGWACQGERRAAGMLCKATAASTPWQQGCSQHNRWTADCVQGTSKLPRRLGGVYIGGGGGGGGAVRGSPEAVLCCRLLRALKVLDIEHIILGLAEGRVAGQGAHCLRVGRSGEEVCSGPRMHVRPVAAACWSGQRVRQAALARTALLHARSTSTWAPRLQRAAASAAGSSEVDTTAWPACHLPGKACASPPQTR